MNFIDVIAREKLVLFDILWNGKLFIIENISSNKAYFSFSYDYFNELRNRL